MTDDHDRIIDCMARMTGDKQPFALATIVRTVDATAAKPGAKAVIRADGTMEGWIGGACAEGAVRKAASAALIDGRTRLIRIHPGGAGVGADRVEEFNSACPSRGTIEVFIEPILPRPSLLVVGASPTARALCAVGRAAGFAVTVAAPTKDLDPDVEADARIAGFDLSADPRSADSFIVVATQGRRDRAALAAALATGAAYVAFIASRRKATALKRQLVEAGADRGRVAAIRAPAGLDIGAATPGEIALSVLAEIVRERRLGAPAHRERAEVPAQPAVADADAAI